MDRDLDERLLDYAARVVKLVEALPNTVICRRLGDQLLRCSVSVGANYEEAQAAESREDFVHKMQVALKEVRESNYWLRLLAKSGKIKPDRLAPIIDESTQLRSIFSKAVATAKKNQSSAS